MVQTSTVVLLITAFSVFISLFLTIFFVLVPVNQTASRAQEIADSAEEFRDDIEGGLCETVNQASTILFQNGNASKESICNAFGFCRWNGSSNTCYFIGDN
ncbi:Transmembrane domain-containing protein [Orpheovirus IHUMI-LCC2]|uniref:Transmembrane domain-containing protein n=1 Tax=Orpheovirus IHUMI-LCC2 TaxID=2023057 RepID=A0A2I2L5T0_9VIRU|nr:Transmembrane domain-containing protein [Orpheovirus IHUMI-LCC2]SNW62876.1 Transmembrane domain-containing protein [Orpheovirus IHUMI-LCC2]